MVGVGHLLGDAGGLRGGEIEREKASEKGGRAKGFLRVFWLLENGCETVTSDCERRVKTPFRKGAGTALLRGGMAPCTPKSCDGDRLLTWSFENRGGGAEP